MSFNYHNIKLKLVWRIQNDIIKFNFTAEYNVISSSYACGHVDGGYPYQCSKSSSSVTSGCEYECTSVSSCIAYEEGDNKCWFIPNSKQCPSGWSVVGSSFSVATSSSDLKASSLSGYFCKAKQGTNLNECRLKKVYFKSEGISQINIFGLNISFCRQFYYDNNPSANDWDRNR